MRVLLALILAASLMGAPVAAGTVTFDASSGPGSIALDFADGDDGEKLKFRRNEVDVTALFELSFQIGGARFDLTGPTGGSLVYDRKENALTFVAAESAAGAGGPVAGFVVAFEGRGRPKSVGELIALFQTAAVGTFTLDLIEANIPEVPLPAAGCLFLVGLGLLRRGVGQRRPAGVPTGR
jgi:hypothetical protein